MTSRRSPVKIPAVAGGSPGRHRHRFNEDVFYESGDDLTTHQHKSPGSRHHQPTSTHHTGFVLCVAHALDIFDQTFSVARSS